MPSLASRKYRTIIEAARDEARRYGATVEFEFSGKHPRFTLSANGRSRMIPFASSPRTSNGCDWVRQDIRRAMRELNA